VVHYIHFNPVEANLCEKPAQWKYSSYNAIVSSSATQVKRDEVIEWFDDLKNFAFVHRSVPENIDVEF
jgi:hypothetical protein